jgi:hypothetical protein
VVLAMHPGMAALLVLAERLVNARLVDAAAPRQVRNAMRTRDLGERVAQLLGVASSRLTVSVAGSRSPTEARLMAFLSFMLGMHLLLGCVGLSGWLHGRRTGWMTAALAAVGMLLISCGTIG